MNNYDKYITQLNRKHKKRQIWLRVLSVLMCVTVFITTYALILPAITMDTNDPSVMHIDWGNISWNDDTNVFENISLTVNAEKDKQYTLQYSDDNGLTWQTATYSGTTYSVKSPKNNFTSGDPCILWGPDSAAMQTSALLDEMFQESPLSRRYRIKWGDNNNGGQTASYDFVDILEEIKPGFEMWLAGDFVNEFHGTPPTTKQEYFGAFDRFYHIPSATLTVSSPTSATDPVSAIITMDPEGTYQYVWSFYDEATGVWAELTEETGNVISDTSLVLQTYGAYVRCRVLDGNGNFVTTSNTEFVNPKDYEFRQAIGIINGGLYGGSGLSSHTENGSTYNLSIDGTIFNNVFYYTQSAANPDVPFYDAASYRYLLCKTYVRAKDNGATDTDALLEVQGVWDRYLYDLFDPDATGMGDQGGTGYPTAGTYGDQTLSWPKSLNDSFHGNVAPVVNDLNWDFIEDGVDYSNFISNMSKYAQADAAGDANSERKYNIDIVADGQAKARAPLALVFQIQTSWQMFDLTHANAKIGEGGTQKGRLGKIEAMATLYDIKWAILDFLDYMDDAYPGNNIVVGITEVRHTVSDSMFNGTDSSNNGLYVTNDMDVLRRALYNWDVFGNCEHVHYTTDAIEDAVEYLASNLKEWKDFYGHEVKYNEIRKVGVVVGGATENTSGTDGYGDDVTWSAFSGAGFNSVYGIRTDEGTPENSDNVLSWLDIPSNNGTPYKDGVGTGFTKKFIATSRADFADALEEIANREFRVGGIDVTAIDKYVENTYIHDTVRREFEIDYGKPFTATVLNSDGSKMIDTVVQFTEGGNCTVTQIVYNDGVEVSRNEITDVTVTGSVESGSVTVSFSQDQTIHLDLMAGPEDRTFTCDNALTINVNSDNTTDVQYVYDVIYNTKKAELNFGIVAREDYFGSNNVYTNVNNETYSGYTHTHDVTDPETHITTSVTDRYKVDCYDTPEVNVPIEFSTVNGGSIIVPAGTTLDLENLDNGVIPADILDRLDNGYEQLNGTLVYTWVNPNGTFQNAGSVHYTDGEPDTAQPTLSDPYQFNEVGDYIAELRLTFVPDPVENRGNFHDATTAEKINQKRRSGYVSVKVLDEGQTTGITVRKEWKGTPAVSSIRFKLVDQNGYYYTGSGSDPIVYTISAANDWVEEVTGLPAVVNGELQTYIAEEIPIEGYISEMESSVITNYRYSSTMSVDFTPNYATNGTTYLRVTYDYNGNEYTMLLPSNTDPQAVSISANSPYPFIIDNLWASDDGEAGTGYIKRIDYSVSSDPDVFSSYISFIGPEYTVYGSEMQQVGFLSLDLIPSSNLKKDKVLEVTYLDEKGVSHTYSGKLTSDVNAGNTLTINLGTVPYSEDNDEFIVSSVTYNGASLSGNCSISLGMSSPIITFTAPSNEQIAKDKYINFILEDENHQQYTISYKVPQNIAAGTTATISPSVYLPEGNYIVVSAVYQKDNNNSFSLTNASVELIHYYQMFARMLAPCDIPAGTSITVNYLENGVAKSFTATTSELTEEGQWLVLQNPNIVNVSDGTIEITSFTRTIGSGKDAVSLPFYQPLNTDVEIYTSADAFSTASVVKITNTPNVKLPSTGGCGTFLYVMTGLSLMAGSIIFGYILRRKREGRVS